MPAFVAGQKLRASQLNFVLPTVAYLTAGVAVNNSTTPVSVTSLSIPLEVNAKYSLDGIIGYDSNTTADAKFGMSIPTGATGWWGFYGVQSAGGATATAGPLEGARFGTFGPATAQGLSGDNVLGMQCRPGGYIATGATAGAVTVLFAQNTAVAVNSFIVAGSWISVTRLA